MIRADAVSRSFGGREVVRDVDLAVGPGEVVGLLGPNGAGKTTVLRLLLGLLRPSSGRAGIDGPVGYLPERFSPYDGLSARGYLRYLARLKGVDRDTVDRALMALSIDDLANRPIGRLSKGQRQRLGIAQALVGSPPAYVLDEPTAGLDPRQVTEVRDLTRRLAADGAAVLVSTHVLAEAAAMCDRVVVLAGGVVVGTEPVTDAARLEQQFLALVARAELS